MEHSGLAVDFLGPCGFDSQLNITGFVGDGERVLLEPTLEFFNEHRAGDAQPPSFELAGPRKKLFFNPAKVKSGIVSCGGLCPGINDVIRGLVMELTWRYGAGEILGFRYGYRGIVPKNGHEPVKLTPEVVRNIHERGGSILSSSRGPQDIGEMVDALVHYGISALFCIGGDGTLKGAGEIYKEVKRRGLDIAVVGIPKTIDNDLCCTEKTFGFETAFTEAVKALRCAHSEAEGAYNGVGLVRLMGRQSGYIAATAAIAENNSNFVLVPEVPFTLEGPGGLFEALENRLKKRHHAVIVTAEGAGQDILAAEQEAAGRDASGNVKLLDIGVYLRDRIGEHFKKNGMEVTVKYIDPSYMIRAVPASADDSMYCAQLARHAVHAAMAGKTGCVVCRWKKAFTYVPIAAATEKRNVIDTSSPLWLDVLEATGQPAKWGK